MTHDPLCPTTMCKCKDQECWDCRDVVLCQCDLIAKVEDRCTPNHFRERIERLIIKANRWRDENAELRKQLQEQP